MTATGVRSGEFDIIRRFFAPLSHGEPGALDLTDDAAFLTVGSGNQLVVTTDAVVSGVHFLDDDPAAAIAAKALRVNLSDLAAKGAKPRAYLLTLMLPATVTDDWLEAFAGGLGREQGQFGIALIGGDTVATPGPLAISITAMGEVVRNRMLQRAGAMPGDDIWVSGTIGDAHLGLRVAQGRLVTPDSAYLVSRYRIPEPRLSIGQHLRGIARACADISDGLVADLGHLCRASGVGAELNVHDVPVSDAAGRCLEAGEASIEALVTGGDDYELVFAAGSSRRRSVAQLAETCGIRLTRVGRITEGQGVSVHDADGEMLKIVRPGFTHF